MAGRTFKIRLLAATAAAASAVVPLGLGVASAGTASRNLGLPEGNDPVHIDPADFSAEIDSRRWPMTVGSRWVYRVIDTEDGSVQRDVIKVTDRTKMIADGVEARVVSDVVTEHGKPVEVTKDWYAQDRDGNVWYFGEDTVEYRHGHASSGGSWEAGVDGALPGVALPAKPRVGMAYREEYSKGEAEDRARVLALDEQVEVGAGHFKNVLMTEDSSPLEPKVSELKFYAKGSGQAVLAVTVSGGAEREELVKYKRG